jgi:SdrD B-like domain/Cadherin domain/Bacterial Ig domain
MTLRRSLVQLFSSLSPRHGRTAVRKHRCHRGVGFTSDTQLEDRILLSAVVVTSAADTVNANDGVVTLREALSLADQQSINFDLPANDPGHVYYRNDGIAGQVTRGNVTQTTATDDSMISDIDPDYANSWWTIRPTTPLPRFNGGVTLDGYSQLGATQNTQAVGNNAVLRIELNGSALGGFPGLGGVRSDVTIRGLVLNRFTAWTVIHLQGNSNTIEGNFIGTDVSGSIALGNGGHAMVIDGSLNTIGTDGDGVTDLGERNIISGNAWWGMAIGNLNTSQNRIAGNYIGTDRSGLKDFGNGGFGIALAGRSNTIGTNGDGVSDLAERNVIAGNGANPGDAGIILHLGGSNVVAGNYIGTNAAGSAAIGNGLDIGGIRVDPSSSGNWIGTNGDGFGDAIEGNVISGNTGTFGGGILMGSANNVVAGNFIGTDATGSVSLGNSSDGIHNWNGGSNRFGTNGDGISDAEERNVISGNGGHGLTIKTSNNVIAGNLIGTDATGSVSLGNSSDGIRNANRGSNRFGTNGDGISDAAERNVISGNGGHGLTIRTSNNVIAGNLIGTDASGVAAIGNGLRGITVSGGGNNRVGTNGDGRSDAEERNVISANGNDGMKLFRSSHNIVAGNYVGTDVTGQNALGNGRAGIFIQFGASNVIGTDGSNDSFNINERNVISSNANIGIRVSSSTAQQNVIAGNHIGTNATATQILGNAIDGIWIDTDNNRVGTDGNGIADTDERNVISGNGRYGVIVFGDQNQLAGNYIGTNVSGLTELGNGHIGVLVYGALNYVGTNGDGLGDVAERNVISGNGWDGVYLSGVVGGEQNVVAGNYIGVGATGSQAIGNAASGVWIDQSSNNIIGTDGDGVSDAAERNVISSHVYYGVGVSSDDWDGDGQSAADSNIIAGNLIGTGASGEGDFGNGLDGVYIFGSLNRVGTDANGTADADEGNLIAFNRANGVNVVDNASFGNSIRGNSIHSNALLGIDLAGDSVTMNDVGDTDIGPNDLQNAPVISNVELGATTRVVGSLNSHAGQQYTIDVYANAFVNSPGFAQGSRFLGSFNTTTDAAGDATFDVVLNAVTSAGEFITSTATDAFGNTSEFSIPSNFAPVISTSVSTVVVDEGQVASNSGSFSDPDGDAVVLTSSVGTVVDEGDGTWSWSWTTNDGADDTQLVTITAADSHGALSISVFMLGVLNVAPIVDDQTFEVVENAVNGTLVGTILAVDAGNDTLVYSVSGGTGASAFAVDAASGEIRVLDTVQLDFETTPAFTLAITVTDSDGAASNAVMTVNLLNQASLTGAVFVDTDQDGLYDANEMGLDGVTVDLLDSAGDVVFSTVTSDGGIYLFEDLDPGTYEVRESQPSGVDDGAEKLGSEGGTVVSDDLIQLTLQRTDASDYYFAEIGQQLLSGDTATIGFWQNKNGQALIAKGGARLADWLTKTFGNIFGDEFVGAGGMEVANFYRNELFKQKAMKSAGPAKVDAQFMAVAFATYFTSRNLTGSDVAADYGFHVSDTGIGTKIV